MLIVEKGVIIKIVIVVVVVIEVVDSCNQILNTTQLLHQLVNIIMFACY